jgi:hypothetical protein
VAARWQLRERDRAHGERTNTSRSIADWSGSAKIVSVIAAATVASSSANMAKVAPPARIANTT